MSFDLATVVPLVVSVLGALGVASIIGQWFAAGKDRRAARATVLTELGAVETARWANANSNPETQHSELRAAIRRLQTAALVARVPRRAVAVYGQLAFASLSITIASVERHSGDQEASALPVGFAALVRDAAEIVSLAAWSSPATRWAWLWRRLRDVNGRVEKITEPGTRMAITTGRALIR